MQRLSFETGYYSRCWEVSSAHICQETGQYLANLADLATPEAFLFIAFRVPYSPAIGVKLISTPWTDKNLNMPRASVLSSFDRSTATRAYA